jgi:hypothetical protein
LGHLNFGDSNLPFGLAQGGESFDFAQDREPVEWLVEPFRISNFGFPVYPGQVYMNIVDLKRYVTVTYM